MKYGAYEIDEGEVTSIIVSETAGDWSEISHSDIVIVGAGPSGMIAAKYLAENGLKTVVFERRLSVGGGIGGGGMLFHKIIVEDFAVDIIRDIGCKLKKINEKYYVLDSAELLIKLANAALDAGAKIILGVTVEDVIYRTDPLRIEGVVINWSAVQLSGLHVDPLSIRAKAVVDATGHDAEILSLVSKKIKDAKISVPGHSSMNATLGERLVVEKTGEVLPGLFVTGMAVATLHGLPRMGPIFGGMLLSGRKVAELILEKVK